LIYGHFTNIDSISDIESAKQYFWINKVEEAIREDKIIMFFQTIVDKDENIINYE
jgi:hypothetical protein